MVYKKMNERKGACNGWMEIKKVWCKRINIFLIKQQVTKNNFKIIVHAAETLAGGGYYLQA